MPAPSSDPSELAFHDWIVEEREIRRHVARRGRQHAFESLDPRRTALVVIDMVPFFVRESAYCRGIVPNVNELADGLRLAGGVVAWVVPGHREPTARTASSWDPRSRRRMRAPVVTGGSGTAWGSPRKT